MKIKIIFSFVLFLAFGVYAQKHPNDLVEVHYDNENAGGVGSSKKDLIIAAKLNADMLAPYVGHKLSAIEVYIHRLRKKIEKGPIRIATVRGLGYCLEKIPN